MLRLLQVLLAPVGYEIWEILHTVCYCKWSCKSTCSVLMVLGTVPELFMTEIMGSSVLESMYRDFVWTVRYFEKWRQFLKLYWSADFYEEYFLFFGCLQILFCPLKSPRTKNYHSSLDAFITLAICLCLLWVRLGKCVFGEGIVEKRKNLIDW